MGKYLRLKELVKQSAKRRKGNVRWAEYLNRGIPALLGPYRDEPYIRKLKDLLNNNWTL